MTAQNDRLWSFGFTKRHLLCVQDKRSGRNSSAAWAGRTAYRIGMHGIVHDGLAVRILPDHLASLPARCLVPRRNIPLPDHLATAQLCYRGQRCSVDVNHSGILVPSRSCPSHRTSSIVRICVFDLTNSQPVAGVGNRHDGIGLPVCICGCKTLGLLVGMLVPLYLS